MNIDHSTPLSFAATQGHVGMVKSLLKHGASVKTPGYGKLLPIHDSIFGKNFEVLQLIVEAGSPLNETSKLGFTALSIAAQEGWIQAAEYLLEKGADANIKENEGRSTHRGSLGPWSLLINLFRCA